MMQEGISFLAGAELPSVIVNVVRGGPGLGNIAPSQADYFQATRGGGHGDYRTIVLAPASVQEMADLTQLAFELADDYRNPVLILVDGILGQMMEPVELRKLPERKLPAKDWALTGAKGRKQNIVRSLWLKEGRLEELNNEIQAKYQRAQEQDVRCETHKIDDAEIIVVAYGATARTVRSAVAKVREKGMKVGWIRPITLLPFPTDVIKAAADKAAGFLVVEMSLGQMVEDVRLAVNGKVPVSFFGRAGGGVPTVEQVVKEIEKLVGVTA